MRLLSPSRLARLWLAATLAAGLVGCKAESTDTKDPYADLPVEVLYNDATDALTQKRFVDAKNLYDEVDRQYPYSVWAAKAELMSAYALYQQDKFDDAVAALNGYIQLHPGNRDVAYAYYMKALCYYEQIVDVGRDQKITKQALDAMQEVARRFPDSPYARDARLRIDLAHDHLAGKEMEIGRYYQRINELNAAINRFLTVVKDYQTTTHVPEALDRLVECYMTLGLRDQAGKVAAVLGYNYPGSKWYAHAYGLMDPNQRKNLAEKQGIMDRTVNSLFKPN
jgi:outer membrane protein assembly factor BamD